MRYTFGRVPGPALGGFWLVLGLLIMAAQAAAGASPASTPTPAKRWAQFELVSTEPDGSVQVGKDVVLGITLGGVPAGTESVDSHTLSPFWKTASKPTSPDYS